MYKLAKISKDQYGNFTREDKKSLLIKLYNATLTRFEDDILLCLFCSVNRLSHDQV